MHLDPQSRPLFVQVSTRKSRSEESFEAINRAASLFIAFMKSREDLQEQNDRKDASIFYPSSYKVTLPRRATGNALSLGDRFVASRNLFSKIAEARQLAYRPDRPRIALKQLLKFVDWQERRASLALQEASPSQSASGSSVQW